MTKSYALSREDKARKAVENHEKRNHRKAVPSKQGSGFDMVSGKRKIEIKTRAGLKGGFVQLGERQFRVLCEEKNYWIYLVDITGRQPRIFEFDREFVLPKLRPYIHFDFVFNKKDLRDRL